MESGTHCMSRPALVSAVLNVFQRKKRQNAHNYPEAHEGQDALWAAKERTDKSDSCAGVDDDDG